MDLYNLERSAISIVLLHPTGPRQYIISNLRGFFSSVFSPMGSIDSASVVVRSRIDGSTIFIGPLGLRITKNQFNVRLMECRTDGI